MGNMLDCCRKNNNETKFNVIPYRSSTINRVLCKNHPWMDESPSFSATIDNFLTSNVKTETDLEKFKGNKLEENIQSDAKIPIYSEVNTSQEKLSTNKLTDIPDLGDSTASQTNKFNESYSCPNQIEEKIIEDFSAYVKIDQKQIDIRKENKEEVKEIEINIPIKQINPLDVIIEEKKEEEFNSVKMIQIPIIESCNILKEETKNEEVEMSQTERRFSSRKRFEPAKIIDASEKTDIDSTNINNNRIQLFFDLKNEIDEYGDIYYELEFFLEKSRNEYELIEKTQNLQNGKNFRFSISPVLTYYFEKNQNMKCFLRSSNNKEIIIITNFGKLIGSQKQGNQIGINKLQLSESDKIIVNYELDFNPINYNENKETLCFIITYNYIETQIENVFSSLGLIFKLNLPIFPEKELRYKLKRNGEEIYTSENKKSNKQFNYLNLFLHKSKFTKTSSDSKKSEYDYHFTIEFHQNNNTLFGVSTEFKYRNLLKSPDIQIKQIGGQNNKIIGNTKLVYEEKQESPFLWYLTKGLKFSLIVGIDYTSSNLEYTNPNSLHYLSDFKQNLYEQAMIKSGSIISYFNPDQMFKLYGFGGIPPKSHDVSHCFNVNFTNNPEVQGIENMVIAYRKSLKYVKLHGPTYFCYLIKKVLENSQRSQDSNNNYNVLMILTDGHIDDMRETIDAIVEASSQPMSIIIIGIGSTDFSNMVILGKLIKFNLFICIFLLQFLGNKLVNSKGEYNVRNIVQFVTINEFENNIEKLSEKVFSALPCQIENYFKIRNFSIS